MKEIYEMKRSGPFHTGYRRGTGHRSKYGAEIPEVAGGHAAETPAAAGIQPFDKLRRIPTPGTSTGGCRGTGKLRGAALGAQIPGL